MQLQDLQPKTKRLKARRIGRGGKRGKTAGRGHKGQKARAGRKLRPEIRDRIKKIPKLRGRGINSNKGLKSNQVVINLSDLEKMFKAKDEVSVKTLVSVGLVSKVSGKMPKVKILGRGNIAKALNIKGCDFSVEAKSKLEQAGGVIA